MTDPNTLGELIRERRLARGLSLGQLATAVGRTAATVRGWERSQHFPAADVVQRLAVALEIDAADIEAFMYREPPSLTVISDEADEEVTPSESTSVSGDASVETAEGEGDDDTAEIGRIESAPAAAAEAEAKFVAASADDLGVMPKIEAPPPAAVEADDLEPEEPDEVAEPAEPADMAPADDVPPVEPEEAAGEKPAPARLGEEDEPGERALVDEPTEAIGPPIAAPDPVPVGPAGVAVRAETLPEPALPPFLAPLRALFDPHKKWLYWVRGSLTVVALLVMLVVLGWAAGELFDGLGEVLDTIESTDTLSDLAPAG